MFENLTEKLSKTLRNLRGVGKLTEDNISDSLAEVRKALLSADVHFRVVREFIEEVKEACLGQDVLKSVSPGQQVVKIINDELVKLLGEGNVELREEKPLRVLMVGLHGAGKTTTSAKLAKQLTKNGKSPMLVACDVYRPAAIDQLEFLATQENFSFYSDRHTKDVPKIARAAWEKSKQTGSDVVIFDTAGRLQIDEELVGELEILCKEVNPHEILLVADAALGQEAVNVAKTFHEKLGLTGIILTKVDGDARGGSALSMKRVTGAPIKFMGVGEKIDDFEAFHPDRLASRILGMGDVVSLVEKAQEQFDEQEAKKLQRKILKNQFDFNDFLSQLQQIKKMGNVKDLMGMIPGVGKAMKGADIPDDAFKGIEAIIHSMTQEERTSPGVLNASRRSRIAKGSGTSVQEVNKLIKQFEEMRKMMKMMSNPRAMSGMMSQMKNMKGGMPVL